MSRDGNRTQDDAEGEKKSLKLKLNRSTLRLLTHDELALVAGGKSPHTCSEEKLQAPPKDDKKPDGDKKHLTPC